MSALGCIVEMQLQNKERTDYMEKTISGLEEVILAPEKEKVISGINEIVSAPETKEKQKPVHLSDSKKELEIPEMRTANSKVFQLEDGSYQEVFYAEDIHFLNDENGKYEELDNTFTEDESGRYYKNGRNRFNAKFSSEENSDELFSVEKDS